MGSKNSQQSWTDFLRTFPENFLKIQSTFLTNSSHLFLNFCTSAPRNSLFPKSAPRDEKSENPCFRSFRESYWNSFGYSSCIFFWNSSKMPIREFFRREILDPSEIPAEINPEVSSWVAPGVSLKLLLEFLLRFLPKIIRRFLSINSATLLPNLKASEGSVFERIPGGFSN